ncbi:MAG: tetratricopeptide repeat protein [Alphaproteobacteria bacterium]
MPEKQDADSLFKMGMRYRNDESQTPNFDQARSYLLAAAKLNHTEAQFELSLLLEEISEYPEAVKWLEKSASLCFGPAQLYLAENLSETRVANHLGNPNHDETLLYRQALAWYEERARAGDPADQYEYAMQYRKRKIRPYNPMEAMRWMIAAAEQDHEHACEVLGSWLLDDKDPQHNTERGIFWLSRAAKLGGKWACRQLGNLCLYGNAAASYKQTHGAKISQLITPDKKAAVTWYEREIELDKKSGAFSGTSSLATLYLSGDHLDQDLGRAERMLLEAANAGNLDSQRLLAREYTSGKRLRKDAAAALHWLKMAYENRDSSKRLSQYDLGYFYEHNNDDSPNYAEAVKWYLKAADQGCYFSQRGLGAIYESGNGVPKDYVQAYKWFLLAVACSYGKPGIREFHADAIKMRDELAKKMTSSDIAEARQLATNALKVIAFSSRDYAELAEEGLAISAS